MPRKSKKNCIPPEILLENVRIDDFANNSNRRKNLSKRVTCQAALKKVGHLEEEEDVIHDLLENEENNEPGMVKKKKKKIPTSASGSGNEYPLDLWFIISRYIKPEDVQTFACICPQTAYVVSTAHFWYSLYRRHQTWSPEMPDELNSWNMRCLDGLRASVIRALHYMYPPFVKKITNLRTREPNFDRLYKAMCVLQWHIKSAKSYTYYFKLVHPADEIEQLIIPDSAPIHLNAENQRTVLEVTTQEMCLEEMVVKQYLSHVSRTRQQLKIHFTSAHQVRASVAAYRNSRKVIGHSIEITLDPVTDVRILEWWHPDYPKNYFYES